MPRLTGTCENCKRHFEFTEYAKQQKYCTATCKRRANAVQDKAKRAAKPPKLIPYAGKPGY